MRAVSVIGSLVGPLVVGHRFVESVLKLGA